MRRKAGGERHGNHSPGGRDSPSDATPRITSPTVRPTNDTRQPETRGLPGKLTHSLFAHARFHTGLNDRIHRLGLDPPREAQHRAAGPQHRQCLLPHRPGAPHREEKFQTTIPSPILADLNNDAAAASGTVITGKSETETCRCLLVIGLAGVLRKMVVAGLVREADGRFAVAELAREQDR